MAVDLLKLGTELTEEEFVKTILSSGDLFPGFYRFTLGTRNYEQGQLSMNGLVRIFLSQISIEEKYTRTEWTSYTNRKHNSLDDRNKSRSDYAVYELLDKKYRNWMTQAQYYDICLMQIDSLVTALQQDTTYFFMGSLIRFTKDALLLGYDDLLETSVMELQCSYEFCKSYIESIYTSDEISKLFLYSNVVASLSFDESDIGTLHMTDASLQTVITAEPNSVLISSNRDVSSKLPIRWAKDILLSEVDCL